MSGEFHMNNSVISQITDVDGVLYPYFIHSFYCNAHESTAFITQVILVLMMAFTTLKASDSIMTHCCPFCSWWLCADCIQKKSDM